jgi:hypothetical protein
MAHRPYPNADRALAQVWRARIGPTECRRYRHVPQRVVLGVDAWRPDYLMDGRTGDITPYPVDEYRLSTR